MNLKVKASDQKISLNIPEASLKEGSSELALSQLLKINPYHTFYVRVEGSIHPHFNIKKDDVLIVDRSAEPANNTLVISVTEGKFTLSKVSKVQNKLYLMPENADLRPIEIVNTMDFSIWGIVTHVIGKV
jgi:DNA polymerase V